jgi:uncharacterized protein YjeT (DUF2065 family)
MDYILTVIGLLLILEGLPYFAAPDKIKTYLMKIQSVPDGTLRNLGLAAVVVGLFLVYLGRHWLDG